ncbi:MAG: glycoside hydrolase family 43 protein [Defluviitaleaceae bacterium]|nr:glycoside hydrolase family 43 protein [Defluviitaleaceae bacterium]
MKYKNPIIPGFYPDPSICKKGSGYYLVTSSFEFFPGVPIFHSKDLVNWQQIGHCLTRKSQLDLENIAASRGIYAATIRYNPHDDLFYMVTTNVTKIGNFYVTAKDPAGQWSEPILVDQGGIDPSLYFDEEGVGHFITNARDRSIHKAGFLMGPVNLHTGAFTSPPVPLWGGIGQNAPEAPHIYKRNNWYYQLIAEGGTELNHMVTIARSRELYGTYQPCPHNPILTHQNQKGHIIQATGHADLIEDQQGKWWAVFLGYRQTHQYFHHLGRETFLAPVEWVDDWPVINSGKSIEIEMELDMYNDIVQAPAETYKTDFSSWDFNWVYLRNPEESCYDFTPKGLYLTGNQHNLSDIANPAFLGIRQPHLKGIAQFEMEFSPGASNEEAGVSVFYKYDAHFDIYIGCEGNKNYLYFRKVVGDIVHIETKLPLETSAVAIKICAEPLAYNFYALINGSEVYLGSGLTRHVSTEAHELGFTGVFYVVYATGNGIKTKSKALFTKAEISHREE